MIKIKQKYKYSIALLLCFLQVAGIDMYGQEAVDSLVVDSVEQINEENMARLDSITNPEITLLSADSIVAGSDIPKKTWVPNPTTATWLAVIVPGGGQIYNRKYWKLPIVYGGFFGCAYAMTWTGRMYRDYSQAYIDIMDKNPSTNSYYNFLSYNVVIDENTDTRYGPLLKKKKDYYRRYRDISVFAFIGVYVLSIIDAYVDAELSNFDITPDLSMRIEPTVIDNNQRKGYLGTKSSAVGLQCSFTF